MHIFNQINNFIELNRECCWISSQFEIRFIEIQIKNIESMNC